MGTLIGVVGESGTGKSTSIENLKPEETFIINVANKPLPFRGAKRKYTPLNKENPNGNYAATFNPETISKLMKMISDKRTEVKTLIIEDSSYITSFEIFDRAKENSYTKQVEIADHYARILRTVQDLRDDLMVIIITHPDVEYDSMGQIVKRKIKTYGKMTDKYMTLDGLFTYILFSGVLLAEDGEEQPRYIFETNDPTKISTAKSPKGVFTDRYIDNDLQFVIEKIREYNED